MPVHGRPEITITSAKRLALQEAEVIVLMVGDETNKDTAKEANAEFIEMPNRPVWAKLQKGFYEAQAYNPDGVWFVGSDDFYSDNYLSIATEYIDNEKGHYLAGFRFYIYDSNNHIYYCPNWNNYHLDSGEIISSYAAKKVNWEFRDSNRNDQATGFGRRERLETFGFKRTIMQEVILLVMQGDWDAYHTLEMYQRIYGAIKVDPIKIKKHFKKEVVNANIKLQYR